MRRCPECGNGSNIIDTRETNVTVKRRRECRICKHRWTTHEAPDHSAVVMTRAIDQLERMQKQVAVALDLLTNMGKVRRAPVPRQAVKPVTRSASIRLNGGG